MPKPAAPKTDIELLTSIDERLRQLTALTALIFTTGKKQQTAIEELARANLSAKAIGDMTGWPTTTVATRCRTSSIKRTVALVCVAGSAEVDMLWPFGCSE